jgi:Outer membrane protein beta-barrel domain
MLLISGSVSGQAALLVLIFGEKAATENFHFSLKAGFNYSIINGYEEGTNRIGGNFGLINNIKLTEKLTLTPEFLPLSGRGIKDVPVLTTGNPDLDDLLVDPSSTDRKLSYIDIPVLLKYKLSPRFSVSAGPQLSFLTGATDIYKSSPLDGAVLTTELEIEDALNTVDLAAAIDLTFILVEPKNGKGVNLYIRFTQGFIDIVKDNPGQRYTNTTIQFGGAFPFVENPD